MSTDSCNALSMSIGSKSAPLERIADGNPLYNRNNSFPFNSNNISSLPQKVNNNIKIKDTYSAKNFQLINQRMVACNSGFDLTLNHMSSDLGYLEPNSTSPETDNDSEVAFNQRYGIRTTPFTEITSPHLPPFESDYNFSNLGKKTLRQTVIDQRNRRFFPSDDFFQDYIEDRFAFWRPTDSQFNIDDTIAGKHPYQQELGTSAFKNDKRVLNFLSSWFYNDNQRVGDLEKQNNMCKSIIFDGEKDFKKDIINQKSSQNSRNMYPITSDIFTLLNNIEFKSNSSSSILPRMNKLLNKRESKGFISNEPTSTHDPIYTAKGIPVFDFELNFETYSNLELKEYIYGHNSSQIMDSMDQEVRNLIEGVDNFIMDCFAATWNYCKSIFSYCQNLF